MYCVRPLLFILPPFLQRPQMWSLLWLQLLPVAPKRLHEPSRIVVSVHWSKKRSRLYKQRKLRIISTRYRTLRLQSPLFSCETSSCKTSIASLYALECRIKCIMDESPEPRDQRISVSSRSSVCPVTFVSPPFFIQIEHVRWAYLRVLCLLRW